MLLDPRTTYHADLPVAADSALPSSLGTDMERLALTLLKIAEKYEVETGFEVQVTPAMPIEALAALAGIGGYSAALLLGHLLQAGIIAQRRQRLVLSAPEALYSLALGVAPG